MNDKAVLVPLDGSTLAEAALPYAEAVAKALGASLVLMTVVEWGELERAFKARPADAPLDHIGREAAERYLTTLAAKFGASVPVSTLITVGEPADEIVFAAAPEHVAMTVMATHGRGGLERWLVGSVADKVMRTSVKPTLLIVPSDVSSKQSYPDVRRVMLPLDGSALAEAALPLATQLALATGATLSLVQALPPVQPLISDRDYLPDLERWGQEAVTTAHEYLERIRSQLPAAVRSEVLVLRGASDTTLLTDFVLTEDVDLVVMSTHGEGGLRRAVLGSMADRLVRSGAPILLVHPPAPEGHGFEIPAEIDVRQMLREQE